MTANTPEGFISIGYGDEQLEALAHTSGSTPENFQRTVLGALFEFMGIHHGKILGCLVDIKSDNVYVTIHRSTVRYDEALQDASTELEWNLAQEDGWPNVNIFLCPRTSDENAAMMQSIHVSGEV